MFIMRRYILVIRYFVLHMEQFSNFKEFQALIKLLIMLVTMFDW